MIARALLQRAAAEMMAAGCEGARREAEYLLCASWAISPASLIINMVDEVPEAVPSSFEKMLPRRCQREPLAYILGSKEFWSLDFIVSPEVLIPRPEPEHAIEQVLQYYPNQQWNYLFADSGTGSGCIAVALATEYPNARVVACDISDKALAVAQQNAAKHGVLSRMSFAQGDLYQALPFASKFDAIVSNPPYVSQSEMLDIEPELGFEPRFALTDEASGLTLLDKLLQDAALHLAAGGMLVVESGLCGMPEASYPLSKLADYTDLAGNFRGSVFVNA